MFRPPSLTISTTIIHFFLGIFLQPVVVLGVFQQASAETVDHLKAGVVKITSEVNNIPQTGTGIIVRLDDHGAYILTASHVIQGDPHPHIYFYSQPNRAFTANLVGMESDNPKGLAALLVEGTLPSDLHPLSFNSRMKVKGGETVTIIGFPRNARTQWAVSRGTIAGPEGTNFTFSGAADGGNSGGPLFINDTVVGVITQKMGEFGFASPSIFAEFALNGWGVQLPHPQERENASSPVASLPDTQNTEELEQLAILEREILNASNTPTPKPERPNHQYIPPSPGMEQISPFGDGLPHDMSDPKYRAGWQAFQAGNLPLAQTFWTEAADDGHTDAMFLVGFMLQQGTGGTFNPEEGLSLWEEAAELGNPRAQQALQYYAQQLNALGYSGNPYYPGAGNQGNPLPYNSEQQRQQQYERLQQIIEQYNNSAKDIIDSIGR